MLGTKTITRMEADYKIICRNMKAVELGTLLRRAQASKDFQDAKVKVLNSLWREKLENERM